MKVFGCITLLLFSLNTFAGGPWAEGKFKGYAEISGSFTLLTTTRDNTYQTYLEFGLTDKITFKGILPFKYVKSQEDIDDFSGDLLSSTSLWGIGNILVGLKYQLPIEKIPFSIGFDTELGTLKTENNQGLRTAYNTYTFIPNISLGMGWDNKYAFVELRPGFRINNFSHYISIVGEFGGKLKDMIWVSLYAELRNSFKNGSFNDIEDLSLGDDSPFNLTGFYRDRQGWFNFGPKLAIELKKGFGINAAALYSLGMANGGEAVSVKAGVYYDW